MLLANLQNAKSKKPKNTKRNELQRLKDALNTSDNLIKLTFSNYNDWVGLLKEGVTAQMLKTFAQGGKNSLIQVGVDSSFDLKNPRAVQYLKAHALDNATSYTETMKSEISQILIDGVDNGASIDDMSASIGQFFDSESQWRAERLARTETIDAYSQGSLEGARQSGVVTGKQWVFDDGKCETFVCPDNADEEYIPLEEDFGSGDDAPPAHPNCECGLIYQTKDLSDE